MHQKHYVDEICTFRARRPGGFEGSPNPLENGLSRSLGHHHAPDWATAGPTKIGTGMKLVVREEEEISSEEREIGAPVRVFQG